jgi:hypothetical protein
VILRWGRNPGVGGWVSPPTRGSSTSRWASAECWAYRFEEGFVAFPGRGSSVLLLLIRGRERWGSRRTGIPRLAISERLAKVSEPGVHRGLHLRYGAAVGPPEFSVQSMLGETTPNGCEHLPVPCPVLIGGGRSTGITLSLVGCG